MASEMGGVRERAASQMSGLGGGGGRTNSTTAGN